MGTQGQVTSTSDYLLMIGQHSGKHSVSVMSYR